jgi:protein-L-isoaspartate(D-aspartate) O-methyltransferase
MTAGTTALRRQLVDRLRQGREGIGDRVLEAFAVVPRDLFLPEVPVETAYQDEAIVTKWDGDGKPISSSSQPAIMGVMLDQLGLGPGQRVLEIGAGTGYNAALMAHLVSPGGEVVTVDIDADLVAGARENLARAGSGGVTVVCADGAAGHPALAPYDRIIATAGVWDLPPAWLDQLAPGGRLVLPLDLGGPQRSVAFEAVDGYWTSRSVVPCGFIRLRGEFAGPERTRVLNPDSELTMTLPHGGELDPQAVLTVLADPGARRPTEVNAGVRELLGGLGLWLGTRNRRWCVLSESATAPSALLPATAYQLQDRRLTAGLLGQDGLALLGRDETLVVLGYGPGGSGLVAELGEQVAGWDAAGRPGDRGLRVDAYPASTPDSELSGRYVLDKTHTRLALSWG